MRPVLVGLGKSTNNAADVTLDMFGRRLVYFIYDTILHFLAILVLPLSFFRALRDGEPKVFFQRLGFLLPQGIPEGSLLLHGVSVGEIVALRPLLKAIQEKHPSTSLIVSSTTRSGRKTANRLFPGTTVLPFPMDLPWTTWLYLKKIKPSAVVLLELEIWPNFLRNCDQNSIPVAIANGRITEKSLDGYRRVQRFLPQFDKIALYCVQNEAYAERFCALSVPEDRVHITGNLKFDSLPPTIEAQSPWKDWFLDASLFVMASTHSPEEVDILSEIIQDPDMKSLCIAIVPRHPDRAASLFSKLKSLLGARPLFLRSEMKEGEPLPEGSVMLVDTFGELEAIYPSGTVAFLGGSLIPHGGQNVLEAAAAGLPVLVGPHMGNFEEEMRLLRGIGALQSGATPTALVRCLKEWLKQDSLAEEAGRTGQCALESGRGATERTRVLLQEAGLLSPDS